MITNDKKYGIVELASLLQLNCQTLRKYELEFNISIPRDSNNNRVYTDKEKEIFEMIIRLKREGLNLKAVKKMIDKSITFIEQKEQTLDKISIDKMSGSDVGIILRKQVDESLVSFENRIQSQFDNLKNSYDEKFEQLRISIVDDIKNSIEQQKKPSLFGKLFNR